MGARCVISSPIPATRSRELLAQRPNELWSWDISKLKGPAKWTYFYLYVILDVFSRYMVAGQCSTAERPARQALIEQGPSGSRSAEGPDLRTRIAAPDARQAGRVPARRIGVVHCTSLVSRG